MNEERKFSISEIEEILDKVINSVTNVVECASLVATDVPSPLIKAVISMNKETAKEVKEETLILLKGKIKAETNAKQNKEEIRTILKNFLGI